MKALLVLYVPLVASYHVTLPRHRHETAGRGRDLALRVARARAVQQQESEEPLPPSAAARQGGRRRPVGLPVVVLLRGGRHGGQELGNCSLGEVLRVSRGLDAVGLHEAVV